jgi:hypothetical protein
MSNDVIAGQNDSMYKLLPSSVISTPRSTTQAKQQKTFRNPVIDIISDCTPTANCPSQEREETSTPYKTCCECRVDERPAGKINTAIEWDDGGK